MTIQEQARHLRELKLEAEAARRHADALARVFKLEQHRLFERMQDEDTRAMEVGGVNFIRMQTEYGQVQDQREFERWCKENDREDLFEEKPRKKLINELVREHLREGRPLPPGLGFYTEDYVSQRPRGSNDRADSVLD